MNWNSTNQLDGSNNSMCVGVSGGADSGASLASSAQEGGKVVVCTTGSRVDEDKDKERVKRTEPEEEEYGIGESNDELSGEREGEETGKVTGATLVGPTVMETLKDRLKPCYSYVKALTMNISKALGLLAVNLDVDGKCEMLVMKAIPETYNEIVLGMNCIRKWAIETKPAIDIWRLSGGEWGTFMDNKEEEATTIHTGSASISELTKPTEINNR